MLVPTYLPHILYSTALTSVSIHLLWQRKSTEEDRARHNAQISILEDLAQQLRSGIRTTDEEVSRLRNLARTHGEGEAQKLPANQTGIQWSDVVWGRKVADRGTSSEWEQKDLQQSMWPCFSTFVHTTDSPT
ncbi:hypothetical protein HYDPIDRAFT_87393 [Hydnomerulius pinastri MD-312]|uniref:Uncharacterized protein n=1 Tax=Hydnomerulius pinastri MD-312 TaxID=994086 RepID=A0A0C9W5D1_9AGAM|nr:hypothetical protein HYDPIDRAFT_103934 [Hydnomerulius pinastri MD-312]KIJ65998.1 hypothetical protein HYDPIDRAFT_87393 [Hydnomerulius pinastri MD-312]